MFCYLKWVIYRRGPPCTSYATHCDKFYSSLENFPIMSFSKIAITISIYHFMGKTSSFDENYIYRVGVIIR